MKICLCIDMISSGGAERVISTLANEFSNIGHEVFLIETSNFDKKPFYSLNSKVKHIQLLEKVQKRINFVKKIPIAKKCINEIKPDVVISFKYQTNFLCYFALKRTGILHIVSERNNPYKYSNGFVSKILRKRVFRKADGCVFQTKDALEFYFKCETQKTAIIDNPLFLSTLPVSPSCLREKTILYVGRLEEQKNTIMLIDAFDSLHKDYPDYILKIYGNGSLFNCLVEYVEKLDSHNRIIFKGNSKTWQEDEKRSSLFVLPSNYEGMPNSLMEAMALGIPCISTNCPIGGPAKLIRNNINGLLTEVGNVGQLISKIRFVLDNPETPVSFAKENVKMLIDYSPFKIASDWIAFIERIRGI